MDKILKKDIKFSAFEYSPIADIHFVTNFDFKNFYEQIEGFEKVTVAFANMNTIYNVLKDKEFYQIINRFFLIIPDGSSVSLLSQIINRKKCLRFPGPDFFEYFIKTDSKYSHFFLGSTPDTINRIVSRAKSENASLKVVGFYSPPFEKKFSDETNNKIVEVVNKSKPDILWVSFGCPKQERWIIENIHRIEARVILGVGAAFDYYSGNLKRPPKIIRKVGLEFLFRFFQQPRKNFKRVMFEPLYVAYRLLLIKRMR